LSLLTTLLLIAAGVGTALVAVPALTTFILWRWFAGPGTIWGSLLLGVLGLGVWLCACTTTIALACIVAGRILGF
jgi:hypothetical protein